ncbi:hypothetical protein [Solimonas sp. SE-A11]|uniref:hypothetical protein n=1 Tax=Solimonas sp. SE-A11 TaxID=3054954 RepID=UPI00259CF59A|nr:hypothetical protein [Solimonas sp. SE-A11]MDM4772604.1 hypothetical protein [Solimonas sp. SE-A11]
MKWRDHRAALIVELGARGGGKPLASLLQILFAPPNLRYLGAILERGRLLSSIGPSWRDLPDPASSASSFTDALVWAASTAGSIDPSYQKEWFQAPGRDAGVRSSPLNRYCISEFPIWSAMLVEIDSLGKNFFNDLCSEVIGDMVSASCKLVTPEAHKQFVNEWQERRETKGRTEVIRPTHPYGPRLSAFSSIEHTLRLLSRPEHDLAWERLEVAGLSADAVLGSPSEAYGIGADTHELLVELSNLLERLDLDATRGGRRFNRLLRSSKLHEIGRGRFVYQLKWIFEAAELAAEESGLTLLSEIDQKGAVGRLSQDYSLEEIVEPSGTVAYTATAEESSLLSPALVVRTKWHYQLAQSINQLPRWTLKALTGQKLAQLLHTVLGPEIDLASDSVEILRSRMINAASFATGHDRKTVQESLWIDDSKRTTISSRIEYRLQDRQFRVSAKRPELVAGEILGGPKKIEDFLCIPDRIGFHHLAEEWFRRQGGNRASIAEADPSLQQSMLRESEIDLELRAAGILPAQIAQALPRAVLDQTGDLASIALWGDWEPVHTRTIRHYLGPMSGGIEKAIDAALLTLIHRAKKSHGRSQDLMKPADDVRARLDGRRIGAPKLPSRTEVQDLCASYRERLSVVPDGSMASVWAYSNSYIAYSAFMMTAALAYRAAIDPQQEYVEVGGRTIALFSDKDSEGFHRRIVPVPGVFVDHLHHLKNHRRLMASLLRSLARMQGSNLFWIDAGKARVFEPLRAERDAGDLWPYRINALRRRMRTRLFERGAPGLPVDVWMGHWNLGACPWMEGSGFQVGELHDLVAAHVEPILIEDGWVAIPSILVDGLAWTS